LFFWRDFEDPILGHHSVDLLPLVGHTGRQGRDVPVHVGLALMAAQRHEIDPLGRGRGLQRLSNVMHHVDYPAEQVAISRHIDDVGAWRNKSCTRAVSGIG
jgi:hypothetical protein